jgi:hypothetical protein
MRTKALILTAAVGAMSIASSMAQVYSVNAVGYVNISAPAGFSMIAHQFVVPSRTLNSILPAPLAGTQIYKYTPSGYLIYTFDGDDLVWTPNGNDTIDLGKGVFINSPAATTLTFDGEVPQGTLVTPTPAGFSITSSQVPQSGQISTALGFPAEGGDQVYQFTASGYQIYTFDADDLVWSPSQPSLAVGESFFLNKAGSSTTWTRTFSVN